jgi:periplasmic protein TonB
MRISRLLVIPTGAAAIVSYAGTPPPLQQLIAPPPVEIPNGTPVRRDPAHPVVIHFQDYPQESLRRNEQGSCMVKLTIGTDGLVHDATLTISTGVKRLDEACLKAYRNQQFLPATQDGKPVTSTIELPINWRTRAVGR